MTDGDQAHPADGPRSDKQDDKLSDKKSPQDPDLASLIDAWPSLPEPVKAGILAMVQAARQPEKGGTDGAS